MDPSVMSLTHAIACAAWSFQLDMCPHVNNGVCIFPTFFFQTITRHIIEYIYQQGVTQTNDTLFIVIITILLKLVHSVQLLIPDISSKVEYVLCVYGKQSIIFFIADSEANTTKVSIVNTTFNLMTQIKHGLMDSFLPLDQPENNHSNSTYVLPLKCLYTPQNVRLCNVYT